MSERWWVRVPLWARIFHFVILPLFAWLTPQISQYKWNQPWHTPSLYPVLAREWYILMVLFSFKKTRTPNKSIEWVALVELTNIYWIYTLLTFDLFVLRSRFVRLCLNLPQPLMIFVSVRDMYFYILFNILLQMWRCQKINQIQHSDSRTIFMF